MRVLFLSTPLVSHTYPMVPLVWALRAAGHHTAVATTGPALRVVDAGVDVIDFDPGRECPSVAELNAARPDIVAHRATKVADGDALLIEATRQYTGHMLAVAETWQPDLIVHSQLQGNGPVAAARLGVPAVEHGASLLRDEDFYERLPRLMPEQFERYDVTALPERMTALDVAPPSVVAPQRRGRPMRYIPFNGGGVLPGPYTHRGSRPRIAVTVGTNILAPNMAELLRRTVSAAPDVDADIVLLLHGIDGALPDEDRLPANVRVMRDWVPLRALLDSCVAIVHHGGAGSILAALDAGVTQLAVPSSAPGYLQCDAVRERGVGLTAAADELDAALLTRVLTDDKLRLAAAEVRAEMAAMPAPADVVGDLVALAG